MINKLIVVLCLLLGISSAVAGEWFQASNSTCKVWNDNPVPGESVVWAGPCNDGIANGNGELQWYKNGKPNGRYVGSINAGVKHGFGVATNSFGIRYEGEFREGRLYGITKEVLERSVFDTLRSKPRYVALINQGEGEWINNEFVLNVVHAEDEEALCKKGMKERECQAIMMLLELNVKNKKQKVRDIEDLKSNSLRCLNAVVPESASQKNSTSEFYGDCSSGNSAQDGLVIWKTKGIPVDIECLSKGVYGDIPDTKSFKSCEKYWVLIPGFCKMSDYAGQCQDGMPHGAGFKTGQRGGSRPDFGGGIAGSVLTAFATTTNYSIYIERGMFSNGKLNGFGRALSLSGCGQAGCSGGLVKNVGWFKQGDKQFDCSAYSECIPKLSGKELTLQKKNWVLVASANQNDFTDTDTFEGAIKAFTSTGKKDDLKKAQSLAKSTAQKKELEFHLLQTVGFEKIFNLTTKVRSGNTSIGTEDSEILLGFFRSINSSIPLGMSWSIKYDKSILPLTYGSYAIELKTGVRISKITRSCFGSACTDRTEIQPYIKTFDVILRPAGGYAANGSYELFVSGASQSAFLGAETGSVLSAVEPVISIESVRQLP